MGRKNRRRKPGARFGEKQINELRAKMADPTQSIYEGDTYYKDLYEDALEKNDKLTFLAEKHRRMAVIWWIIAGVMFWAKAMSWIYSL